MIVSATSDRAEVAAQVARLLAAETRLRGIRVEPMASAPGQDALLRLDGVELSLGRLVEDCAAVDETSRIGLVRATIEAIVGRAPRPGEFVGGPAHGSAVQLPPSGEAVTLVSPAASAEPEPVPAPVPAVAPVSAVSVEPVSASWAAPVSASRPAPAPELQPVAAPAPVAATVPAPAPATEPAPAPAIVPASASAPVPAAPPETTPEPTPVRARHSAASTAIEPVRPPSAHLDGLRGAIRARLLPEPRPDDVDSWNYAFAVAPGLRLGLELSIGRTRRLLLDSELPQVPIPAEELFEAGWNNAWAQPLDDAELVPGIRMLRGPYAATRVADFGPIAARLPGAHGLVVAVPTSDLVLYHPVGRDTVVAVERLALEAERLASEGGLSATPYFFAAGRLEPIRRAAAPEGRFAEALTAALS